MGSADYGAARGARDGAEQSAGTAAKRAGSGFCTSPPAPAPRPGASGSSKACCSEDTCVCAGDDVKRKF